jgi:hypothetical protein
MRRILHSSSDPNGVQADGRGERAEDGSECTSYVDAVLFGRRRMAADRADRRRPGEIPATDKKGTNPCAS